MAEEIQADSPVETAGENNGDPVGTEHAEGEATQPSFTTDEQTVVGEDTPQETIYADKFKSVSELENSYKELQSTFSKKLGEFAGTPEDGYQLNPDAVLLPNEAPLVDFLQEWGTENQLSQGGFESLITKYTEVQDKFQEQQLQQEYAKLGDNAGYRLQNARDFLEANVGKELTEELSHTMTSAAAVEAIEKLITLTKAPQPAQAPQATLSKDKIDAMRFATNEHGDRLMSVDPAYRNKVLQLEAKLLK